MGAKTWMVVYAERSAREALAAQPVLDREATLKLATTLFPEEGLSPIEDGDLSFACPPDNEICVGSYAGISIAAAKEFGIDYPSKLAPRYIEAGGTCTVTLHAMHSVVDWFAYAQWTNGRLVRALSLSPDSGIIEDIGARLPFEEPYWAGQHAATDDSDDYPLPFHPLDLGEAALSNLFGYTLEGPIDSNNILPETVRLARYRRSRSWWRSWK